MCGETSADDDRLKLIESLILKYVGFDMESRVTGLAWTADVGCLKS